MTQPRNEMEHRWGERIRMDMPVHVSADEVTGILGSMTNLSLSGALLRIDANLRLNALIEVSVELPQPSPPAILFVHVSRKGKEDVGIEWREFALIVVRDLLRSPRCGQEGTENSRRISDAESRPNLGSVWCVTVLARGVTRNLEGGVGVEWREFAPSAVTDLLRPPSF